MANVIFKQGTRAQYDAIATKDSNTLYWLSDTQELFKGDVLYGKGAEATALASGLMSAAQGVWSVRLSCRCVWCCRVRH